MQVTLTVCHRIDIGHCHLSPSQKIMPSNSCAVRNYRLFHLPVGIAMKDTGGCAVRMLHRHHLARAVRHAGKLRGRLPGNNAAVAALTVANTPMVSWHLWGMKLRVASTATLLRIMVTFGTDFTDTSPRPISGCKADDFEPGFQRLMASSSAGRSP